MNEFSLFRTSWTVRILGQVTKFTLKSWQVSCFILEILRKNLRFIKPNSIHYHIEHGVTDDTHLEPLLWKWFKNLHIQRWRPDLDNSSLNKVLTFLEWNSLRVLIFLVSCQSYTLTPFLPRRSKWALSNLPIVWEGRKQRFVKQPKDCKRWVNGKCRWTWKELVLFIFNFAYHKEIKGKKIFFSAKAKINISRMLDDIVASSHLKKTQIHLKNYKLQIYMGQIQKMFAVFSITITSGITIE